MDLNPAAVLLVFQSGPTTETEGLDHINAQRTVRRLRDYLLQRALTPVVAKMFPRCSLLRRHSYCYEPYKHLR
ncbi:hypothetical protein K491DRAFT_696822 [Lophiostoma macrostomum CBS 122681]|uniref:Uncharacterized protein n=1 Tax=Lophiostoma macrostomum CBS 122681 TaxID=1314788 RepID=A0A6A6SWL7_9PLEO|nr:hypothetical protein K491DRAFT_696822 [Lophiostoma macrostomum CBS 122681]